MWFGRFCEGAEFSVVFRCSCLFSKNLQIEHSSEQNKTRQPRPTKEHTTELSIN